MRWRVLETNPECVQQLSEALGISRHAANLLATRGLTDPDRARCFLSPRLDHLHDPFLMRDMSRAAARLNRAIELQEKILIYGDYDVDGTMAAVLLHAALRARGARASVHIPDRFTEGYGMRTAVIERAVQEGARVIVSVDNGIREYAAFGRMRELGIDGILTDHHLPGEQLPDAYAILNPRCPGCEYPEKNLAGAGVALKLAQALIGTGCSEALLRSYLKVVAIGSIADVVPLTGENRVIAHYGLAGLTESARAIANDAPGRAGITALIAVAGLAGRTISAGDVAFRLAPRLNAAGRMETARHVVDLFSRSAGDGAQEAARRLDDLNAQRQRAEEEVVCAIRRQVELRPQTMERFALVFAGDGWHRGVIGIAAQRIATLLHRPTLVISIENGVGHGSGRSIPGFHLLEALTRSRSLFERLGGHAQAAGFSIAPSRIQQLEDEFEHHARSVLSRADLEPELRIDATLSLDELSPELYQELTRIEPFGCGNPSPVFAAEASLLAAPRVFKEKHLKLWVAGAKKRFPAIGWDMAACAPGLAGATRVALAFSLDEDIFDGLRSLRLTLRDVRPSDGTGFDLRL